MYWEYLASYTGKATAWKLHLDSPDLDYSLCFLQMLETSGLLTPLKMYGLGKLTHPNENAKMDIAERLLLFERELAIVQT